MKTLLVTGGCGFIGSNFIRIFLKSISDWNVINLDSLTYAGNPANNADYAQNPRYSFIHGDIVNRSVVFDTVKKVQAIINFAAETHVDRSIADSQSFLTTNVLGLKNLLDAAMECKVGRFIHISTDEVYGSIAKGSVTESANLEPNSPYSAAKAASDLLARSYTKTYHYPIMIIRSSNNYGPYQFPEKVIPLFITNLIEGKKVPLYGKGDNCREWIHVEDNCRGILLVFQKGKEGEIYNLGSSHELTNLELTKTILKEMNVDESFISYVQDRPGHDFRYCIDTSKIQALGFRPQWNFQDGLRQTIQWYREHTAWWSPLKKDSFTLKT